MGMWLRWKNLFRRERLDGEIEAELRAHIEMAVEDSLREGMSEPEARRIARLRFGNPVAVRERTSGADACAGAGRDLEGLYVTRFAN